MASGRQLQPIMYRISVRRTSEQRVALTVDSCRVDHRGTPSPQIGETK
jgi:hypothetical protein